MNPFQVDEIATCIYSFLPVEVLYKHWRVDEYSPIYQYLQCKEFIRILCIYWNIPTQTLFMDFLNEYDKRYLWTNYNSLWYQATRYSVTCTLEEAAKNAMLYEQDEFVNYLKIRCCDQFSSIKRALFIESVNRLELPEDHKSDLFTLTRLVENCNSKESYDHIIKTFKTNPVMQTVACTAACKFEYLDNPVDVCMFDVILNSKDLKLRTGIGELPSYVKGSVTRKELIQICNSIEIARLLKPTIEEVLDVSVTQASILQYCNEMGFVIPGIKRGLTRYYRRIIKWNKYYLLYYQDIEYLVEIHNTYPIKNIHKLYQYILENWKLMSYNLVHKILQFTTTTIQIPKLI